MKLRRHFHGSCFVGVFLDTSITSSTFVSTASTTESTTSGEGAEMSTAAAVVVVVPVHVILNMRKIKYKFIIILYYAIYGSTQAHKDEQLKYIKSTSKIQKRKYKSKSTGLRTLSQPTRNRATAAGPAHNTDTPRRPTATPRTQHGAPHQPRPQHPRPTDHTTSRGLAD